MFFVVSHSLSCTALEWEWIRDLADDAGKSMSPFIVDRVLGRADGPMLIGRRRLTDGDGALRASARDDAERLKALLKGTLPGVWSEIPAASPHVRPASVTSPIWDSFSMFYQ